MSSKKSESLLQTGIQLGEKIIRGIINATIQCVKWLWQAGNWSHKEYLSLRGYSSTNPAPWWEKLLAAAGIFLLMILFIRFVIPWIL